MEIVFLIISSWLVSILVSVAADSLPHTRRITVPTCRQCGEVVSFFRYVFCKNCAVCGTKEIHCFRRCFIQIGYPLAAIWLWFSPPARLGFWAGIILLAYFLLVGIIDLEYKLVLHPVSLVGGVAGLALGIWQKGFLSTILGGIAGFGMMLGLYYFGILFSNVAGRIRGQKIEEVALGYGDVILAGIIGLMLGWPELVGGILTAIILGGVFSGAFMLAMMIFRKYRPMTAIPYAPFLLIGAFIFLYLPKQ